MPANWRAALRQAQEWIEGCGECERCRRGESKRVALLTVVDAALAEPEVALRVNDSNLFVYGNNEATKVVQDALSKPDALRERVAALEAERDALVSAILATIGGTVEGYPTTRLNYLQRLRQLTAREALADQLSEALTDWSGYRPPSVRRAHAAYRAGWEGRDG